jgi:hypothetical protein
VCRRRHFAIEIDGSGHENKPDADQKRHPPESPLDRGDFDSFQNWKDGLTHPIFVDINKDLNSY